jgi:hypothetical protein
MPEKTTITSMPLSGNVTQSINPWTWWNTAVNQLGGQFGIININTMASGDPTLEREIVHNVASYGRQLGRVIEVLTVLIDHKGALSDLSTEHQKTIADFQKMAEQIATTKEGHAPILSADDTQRFLDRLMALKTTHPDRYATLRAQIMDRVRGAGL